MVSTRREILRRGGVLAGALLLGAAPGATAIGGTRARGTRGAPGRSGLDDARRGAFAALAAVALTDPALRLDPAAAGELTGSFAAEYETWPDERRRAAEGVLDGLSRSAGRDFGRMDTEACRAHLRGLGRIKHAEPDAAECERTTLAAAALALVVPLLGPADELSAPPVAI